ncbi:MAG: hypothetical protein IZT59_10290 [Verrucomicrobia bacterium]|nr:hypothetical protein [Verrucomicrobiota bacterium]|tara:strand:+ start:9556 stop:9825 length:270 start_codon:yes stop_codon:yes gene_type:complete
MHRNEAWIGYQTERFAKGMHPDTHPNFWDDWIDPPFPKLPGPTLRDRIEDNPLIALLGLVAGITLVVVIFLRFIRRFIQGYQASSASNH